MASAALALGACGDSKGNQPPVLSSHRAVIDEDTVALIPVLDDARDPDGDPLTVTSAGAPGHAVTIVGGTTLMVTPAKDLNGTVEVTYEVSDGVHTVTGDATVVVNAVNDAPVAPDGTQQVHGPAVVMVSGSDVDGDPLTYELVTGSTHGTLKGDLPAAEYVPEVGFVGDDAIIYRVHDGALASAPATLHLQVSPGVGPRAMSAAIDATEDTPAQVPLHGSDLDGNALTFTVLTQPAHGTLDGSGASFTYTPEANFNGDDALTFSVHNGYAASAAATITLHVAPVNDAPVAFARSVQATEDISTPIMLAGVDIEGSPLTFQIQAGPSHGSLSGSGADRTYTPAPEFYGDDSFTFVVSDGVLTSAPATVMIAVAPVDDPPVAMPLSVAATEDTPAAVTLIGVDRDGDPLSFVVTTSPAHGALSGTPPNLTYVPAADFNGDDSFTFTTSSNGATSPPATVTIHVAAVNDPPVAIDATVTTPEDTPVAIQLQATDVDSPSLSFTITQLPSDGTLTGSGANRTYTPAANVYGSRTLAFRVSDGTSVSSATVRIDITPVNDPPVARDNLRFTPVDTPVTTNVVFNDFDVDGDVLTVGAVDPPAHGTIEILGARLAYTPDPGFIGIEDLLYTVVDGHGGSATAHLIIGVGTFPPGFPDAFLFDLGGTVNIITPERAPSISGDGRFTAFSSTRALTADDSNGVMDVYFYDRGTNALSRISASTAGQQANGPSVRPRVSSDGRYVVFESTASNLVPGDTNGVSDVFRRDTVTGETLRISVATGGGQASGGSIDAAVSDDGNLVVFSSVAFDLVANDANGASDVFLRDVAAGTTTRLSVGAAGNEGDAAATEPRLSADGRFVAFTSLATNLVPGDTNNVTDVFVRDRTAGTLARISVSSTGGQADRACKGPSMSRDGRFISFLSDATNLFPGTSSGVRVYTRDTQASTTTRAEVGSSAVSASLSGDGRYLAIYDGRAMVFDRFAGVAITPAYTNLAWPAMSGSGRYVAQIDTDLQNFQLMIQRIPP